MTTRNGRILSLAAAWGLILLAGNAAAQTKDAAAQQAVVNKYCVTCHSDKLKTGGLSLEKIDFTQPGTNAETLEKVVRKLRVGAMPPLGLPKPDEATRSALITWIETELDRYAAEHPNPGRPALHRLNRVEYANAIRDLLGVEIDAESLLPSDNSSYGFDNVAAVLGMSPMLLERYVSASAKIARLAVGDEGIGEIIETYKTKNDLTQEDHLEGLPSGTRGGILAKHTFPLDGEYFFKVRLERGQNDIVRGIDDDQQFEIALDGQRLKLLTFGGQYQIKGPSRKGLYGDEGLEVRAHVNAGLHTITATFLKKSSASTNDILEPFQRVNINATDTSAQAAVDSLSISGPYDGVTPHQTLSRGLIFTCYPKTPSEENTCANTILSHLAERAYRRKPTGEDLARLTDFYREGRRTGDFDSGIEQALRRVLASPSFIYRFEADPPNVAPGASYALSDTELASRLSFFLWSSMPDEELMNLALQGKLKDPAVLEQQARRMLADPKSDQMISNFFGQWLELRRVDNAHPDPELFPDFNDNLRSALKQETRMLAASIVHEDRSLLDLLNANYTFVNERLARHYGIPNVYGTQFRRVEVTDDNRRGLLGQGSILLVNSYATRTSPVRRGKWILDNILGVPPPSPPPNVPPLSEKASANLKTVRERMEDHRKNPACAACHKVMDPLGFGLENFDATGAWRTTDSGEKIDPSGTLLDGSQFSGPVGLRKALLAHPDSFAGNVTEKLLTYALGRGVEYYDMPAVRAVTRSAAPANYRFSSVVVGIVKSAPFRMRIKQEDGNAEVAAR